MSVTRRKFLKTGFVGLASVPLMGMLGCSQPDADSSQEGSSSDLPSNQEASSSDLSSSASTEGTANVNEQEETMDAAVPAGNAAVIYFSATGNTASVAEKIAQATGGELMEIIPQDSYTPEDLDYNSDCRANTEQNSGTARPAIASPVPDVAGADVVYLGYPIWWGKAPRIILTWLESQNLSGKTVVPFCTSGSSGIGGSIPEIEGSAADAAVKDGMRFPSSVSQQEIDSWISGLA